MEAASSTDRQKLNTLATASVTWYDWVSIKRHPHGVCAAAAAAAAATATAAPCSASGGFAAAAAH